MLMSYCPDWVCGACDSRQGTFCSRSSYAGGAARRSDLARVHSRPWTTTVKPITRTRTGRCRPATGSYYCVANDISVPGAHRGFSTAPWPVNLSVCWTKAGHRLGAIEGHRQHRLRLDQSPHHVTGSALFDGELWAGTQFIYAFGYEAPWAGPRPTAPWTGSHGRPYTPLPTPGTSTPFPKTPSGQESI